MFDLEQDERGGGDGTDPIGAQADSSQSFECGLQQRVSAFADGLLLALFAVRCSSVSAPSTGILTATVRTSASPS